eukprot:TRINITY_DN5139_c1_g2_i5.p1 TRINITY_DN5139_c1_g2~~TRINITY_DN5139_c1_g2_i5.p1  ORF type:complete len:320 (+),score=-25.68 TRINITY_DN5139_c1_g2_i5:340-1299(+)
MGTYKYILMITTKFHVKNQSLLQLISAIDRYFSLYLEQVFSILVVKNFDRSFTYYFTESLLDIGIQWGLIVTKIVLLYQQLKQNPCGLRSYCKWLDLKGYLVHIVIFCKKLRQNIQYQLYTYVLTKEDVLFICSTYNVRIDLLLVHSCARCQLLNAYQYLLYHQRQNIMLCDFIICLVCATCNSYCCRHIYDFAYVNDNASCAQQHCFFVLDFKVGIFHGLFKIVQQSSYYQRNIFDSGFYACQDFVKYSYYKPLATLAKEQYIVYIYLFQGFKQFLHSNVNLQQSNCWVLNFIQYLDQIRESVCKMCYINQCKSFCWQ